MNITVSSPFPAECLPRVWTWMESFRERICDDYSPRTLDEFVARQMASPEMTWAVHRDGELGGFIAFLPWDGWAGKATCVFKRALWSPDVAVPAMRQALDQLRAAGFGKVLMMPLDSNAQIKGVLNQLGARKVGVLTDQTRQRGQLRNVKLYEMLLQATA